MLAEKTVNGFVAELASDSPAPGGGSVAALCGALGAALSAMVGRLTVGRERYKSAWPIMESVIARSDALAAGLLALMEEDTAAFNAYMAARKLPKDTEEQKQIRSQAMAAASVRTTEVPLATLEACVALIELAGLAAESGNPNAVTDAGTAALLARAGAGAAAYNVLINLPGLSDAEQAAAYRRKTEELNARAASGAEEINRRVTACLSA